MSPGPDFIITIRQTINHGRKYAYYSSLGIGLGIAFHLSYTILGISLILKQLPIVFNFIKLFGALYLIYLGIENLRDQPSLIKIKGEKEIYSLKRSFITGFFTNLLNPKATLFFLSIFSSIVSSKTPLYIQGTYGIFCIIANIVWYSLIAYLLSKNDNLQFFNKYQAIFEKIIGVILVLLGMKLCISIFI